MADEANEAEGARRRSRAREEAASSKLDHHAAAGCLVLLGGGGGGLVLLHARPRRGGASRSAAAEAAVFVDCPKCWSICRTRPATARNISRSRSCSRCRPEAWSTQIKPVDAARDGRVPDLSARAAPDRPRRLGRALPPEGRTDPARQRRDRAEPASTPCCSRKSSFSDATDRNHGRQDQIDQDALAAEWGACARCRADPRRAAARTRRRRRAVRRPWPRNGRRWSRTAASSSRRQQGRRRAHPQPGGDRQPARLQPRRRHAQRQFRHPRDHQLGDGLLRASADARNRLRPPGAADDDEPAQFHLRQRRGLARPHHLGALRRLSQLDSAARRSWRCSRPRSGTISACSRSIPA